MRILLFSKDLPIQELTMDVKKNAVMVHQIGGVSSSAPARRGAYERSRGARSDLALRPRVTLDAPLGASPPPNIQLADGEIGHPLVIRASQLDLE